jgi:ferredoxin, 2Fe-2S
MNYKIFVTDLNGVEHTVEAYPDYQIMEIIRDAGLPILAQCGGSCACSTCHVYVHPDWVAKLAEPNDEEIGMLDGAFEVRDDSRLSCQMVFTPDLDGLKLTLAPGSVSV